MFCISCGFKNPDEARFCMKCGAALVERAPAAPAPAAAAPKPASTPQPLKANAKPATPLHKPRGAFDFDSMIGAIAVGLGSLLLAFILVHFGFNALDENTRVCTAGGSACYSNGWYTYFLLAFGVAAGGLKMASRIGKK
jgi:hypothetical protein